FMKLPLTRMHIDVNACNSYKESPLWAAVDKGHENMINLLLARKDIDVNTCNLKQ
ncbi:hypothetical protein CERZMDRAFT_42886, partial [Cercospora zeae-maydis SCOH1-5]